VVISTIIPPLFTKKDENNGNVENFHGIIPSYVLVEEDECKECVGMFLHKPLSINILEECKVCYKDSNHLSLRRNSSPESLKGRIVFIFEV
jgi:hypothetical protein